MALTPASAYGNAGSSYLAGAAFAGNAAKVAYLLGLPGTAPPGFPTVSVMAGYSNPAATALPSVALRVGPRCIMIPYVNWNAP